MRTAALAAVALVAGIAAVTAAAGGCARGRPGGPGASGPAEGALVVRGSDTMVNLAAAWAEAFMAANPDIEVSVSGGGSSTGFSSLIDGSADLADASRAIKDSERQSLEGKGRPPVEHVVAVDAVAVVVNPANPVTSLNLGQLAGLLTGRVTNWRDVGGPDLAVTIYSRETSSGTFAFMQERVTAKRDFSGEARLLPATEAILLAVAQDRGGLGYVGLGYVTKDVRALPIAPDDWGAAAVEPSATTAADGRYPLSRPLFIYSAGTPGRFAQLFLDFCVSETGREITAAMGFVPPPGGK